MSTHQMVSDINDDDDDNDHSKDNGDLQAWLHMHWPCALNELGHQLSMRITNHYSVITWKDEVRKILKKC